MFSVAGEVGLIHLFLHIQGDGGDDVLVLAVINILCGLGDNFLVILALLGNLCILRIQPLDRCWRFPSQYLASDLHLAALHHLHGVPVDDDGRAGLHLDGDHGEAGLNSRQARSRTNLAAEPRQHKLRKLSVLSAFEAGEDIYG